MTGLAWATPAEAFTFERFPMADEVDGYDVEETTDNGQTWKVVASVPTCAALCSVTLPEPTGRPQWRVVAKSPGWRVPSTVFFGTDAAARPQATSQPPAAVDAI